jgi:lipid-A-disaccharide synthase
MGAAGTDQQPRPAPVEHPLRVALVAGENSGDQLGAGLIRELARLRPGSHFEGLAGPRMVAAGCTAVAAADELAAYGLVDVLRHLPRGLRLRQKLLQRWRAEPPDVFVGIDAPAFNLGLEARLHAAGIPTVHYVSPTVWAWRRYRLRTLRRGVDLLLTLFPFEAEFCIRHGMPALFVGHPLAEAIPLLPDRAAARRALDLEPGGRWVALLPGSRSGEIAHLAGTFLAAAAWLHARRPDTAFLLPLAAPRLRTEVERALARHPGLPLRLLDGQAREALVAADAVLVASGTASLETLLAKRPMVVAYRVAQLTYLVTRPLVRLRHFALPNLLAGRGLVPEFIQGAATPEALGESLQALLDDPAVAAAQVAGCLAIHHQLRRDADRQAADAVLGVAARGRLPEVP